MPNARVGALPQPPKTKEQQQQEMSGRGRSSRHKGITMEDLKQQTAMRLAHEQNHGKNGLPGGASAGGHQMDGAAQQQDPTNVLNNSHLAHFNHYNAVHQQGMLHHGYEMRDRVYSADGSCASSLTNDNGGDSSSSGLPVSTLTSSAAATAGAAAPGLSPMGHAPAIRVNHPLLIATGDNERQQNKHGGKGNVMGTSKSSYARGSPSYSQRQSSSQQVQLGGHSSRLKPVKKKQQRQKMTADADMYSPTVQQQYQGYASMDMNNHSVMNYSAPVFQPDRHQRGKKGAHRHGANAHAHFYPQTGMPHHGYHDMQFGGKQSKLPHGLTVQELKEMTKARLAAEAAEKNDPQEAQGDDQFIVVQQDPAQPDVSSNHSVVTQASSSSDGDSYRRLENKQGQGYYPYIQNRQNSMESAASAPPTTPSGIRNNLYQNSGTMCKSQSHHGLSDFSHIGTQPQGHMLASPEHNTVQNFNQQPASHRGPPPGLSNIQQGHLVSHHSNQGVQNQHQATHQRQQEWRQQLDALETASVNSMNSGLGSEYLGSDSAFGLTQHTSSVSMNDDSGNLAFGRSRSYPAGGNISNALEQPSHENTPMSTTTSSSSLFDYSSGGANRRRTSTMSPPLSNLHEDRPLTATSLCADDYLSIPLFDSTPNSQQQTRVHHVEFSPSPAPSRESSPAFSRYGGSNPTLGSGSMSDLFHRPNSVSTVPTVTPSIDNEDDHEDLPPPSYGLSDRATSTGGASMCDELLNSVAESVLGTPLIMEDRKVPSADNTNHQHSAIKRSDESDISAVFRNSPGYVGSESSALGYHVPGREVSLSSTSSFFSDTNILNTSSDFGASRSRTHSWAGSTNTNAMTPIGASTIPGPPSNLADDLNKLLDFSDTKESNSLSTPWETELVDDQQRAPSLVSRIDPELKVGSGILGGDPLPQYQDHCVPPVPHVSDTDLDDKGPKTNPDAETSIEDKDSAPGSSQNNKRGGSAKRKNRRGRRKLKADQRACANP